MLNLEQSRLCPVSIYGYQPTIRWTDRATEECKSSAYSRPNSQLNVYKNNKISDVFRLVWVNLLFSIISSHPEQLDFYFPGKLNWI